MSDSIIDPQRFSVISAALEDCRRIVATAKSQRWDVFKWAIALELTLATALVAFRSQGEPLPTAFALLIAVLIVIAALLLIFHYNARARGARVLVGALEDQLRPVFDLSSTTKPACVAPTSFWYDWPELLIFGALLLLAGSCVAAVPFLGN